MTAEAAGEVSERLRLMRDGLVNSIGTLLSSLVGLILVPIVLRGLGADSYGLLLASMSVAGIVAGVDFGLEWAVTREIAAEHNEAADHGAASFVLSAGNIFLRIGCAGAVALIVSGFFFSRAPHLSAATSSAAPAVFALTGLMFIADRMSAYALAILVGTRRFDLSNLVGISGAVARAMAILLLLAAGGGVLAIAAGQAVIATLVALTALAVSRRASPRFRFRLGRVDWPLVRKYAPSGLTAALALAVSSIYWQMPQLVLGVARGTALITQYYTAQRFPLVLLLLGGRVTAALLPSAASRDRERDAARLRQVLEVGMRWIFVLLTPCCVVLWLVAPHLLRAWVGAAPDEAVLVLRLTTASVLIDSLAGAPMEVLWGCGMLRTIVAVLVSATTLNLALGLILLGAFGVDGVAWAMFVTATGGAIAFVVLASRACAERPARLLARTLAGLSLPVAACAAATLLVLAAAPPGWPLVVAGGIAGGGAFVAALLFTGGRPEERAFARELSMLFSRGRPQS